MNKTKKKGTHDNKRLLELLGKANAALHEASLASTRSIDALNEAQAMVRCAGNDASKFQACREATERCEIDSKNFIAAVDAAGVAMQAVDDVFNDVLRAKVNDDKDKGGNASAT